MATEIGRSLEEIDGKVKNLNKVQIVFGDEIIEMITKNVPHINAMPKREMAN